MNCSIGIEPNPDLSGIGVRASIYIQVLLPLLPEIVVLLATRSVPRSDVARRGMLSSVTILITGYAMLFSAIIQAKAKHLTVYHALLTLNLNWLICLASTDSCYFFFAIIPSIPLHDAVATQDTPLRPGRTLYREETSLRLGRPSSRHSNSLRGRKSLRKIYILVIWTTSLHLSLTSAFGVWMFSNPKAFDKQTPSCTAATIMSMFGADFNVSSSRFRNAWLTIYSLTLLPVVNMGFVFLIVVLFWVFAVHIWWIEIFFLTLLFRRYREREGMSLPQFLEVLSPYFNGTRNVLLPCFIISFTLTQILFIVSTELTIRRNNVQAGEDDWSFGQTLTLFLILPAIWDALQDMYATYKEHETGEDRKADVRRPPSRRLTWP